MLQAMNTGPRGLALHVPRQRPGRRPAPARDHGADGRRRAAPRGRPGAGRLGRRPGGAHGPRRTVAGAGWPRWARWSTAGAASGPRRAPAGRRAAPAGRRARRAPRPPPGRMSDLRPVGARPWPGPCSDGWLPVPRGAPGRRRRPRCSSCRGAARRRRAGWRAAAALPDEVADLVELAARASRLGALAPAGARRRRRVGGCAPPEGCVEELLVAARSAPLGAACRTLGRATTPIRRSRWSGPPSAWPRPGRAAAPGRSTAAARTLRDRRASQSEVRAWSSQARASAVLLALAPLGFAALTVVARPGAVASVLAQPAAVASVALGLLADASVAGGCCASSPGPGGGDGARGRPWWPGRSVGTGGPGSRRGGRGPAAAPAAPGPVRGRERPRPGGRQRHPGACWHGRSPGDQAVRWCGGAPVGARPRDPGDRTGCAGAAPRCWSASPRARVPARGGAPRRGRLVGAVAPRPPPRWPGDRRAGRDLPLAVELLAWPSSRAHGGRRAAAVAPHGRRCPRSAAGPAAGGRWAGTAARPPRWRPAPTTCGHRSARSRRRWPQRPATASAGPAARPARRSTPAGAAGAGPRRRPAGCRCSCCSRWCCACCRPSACSRSSRSCSASLHSLPR